MLFLLALQNEYFGDHFDSYFRIFSIFLPWTWLGVQKLIWILMAEDVQSWETFFVNRLQPSVWSCAPSEPSCVQMPCLVQRDACGCLSPYIALLCLLTVQNSLTGGEWCCTRPGQPYFKRELSAESVQGQPLHLFLSGNYSSYRHPYTKQTPSNTCAAAFLCMLASWRLAKMPWQQMLADLQTKPRPIFPCTRTTPR